MSDTRLIVGCVQICPSDDRAANIDLASRAVREAQRRGASLVALPEYVSYLHASGSAMRNAALTETDDPALSAFQALAAELGLWLLVGSIVFKDGSGKLANRSFMLDPQGAVASRYDKIHLFDATLPNGREIRESSTYQSGGSAVTVEAAGAKLGMSICYDVRFPALYRSLAQAGAEILAIPSAFTKATGTLHWRSLLQARAIENGAYVIAPATCGTHPGGHQTFGHALIVDPNGQVIAEAGDEPEVLCAEIDLSQVALARSRIPSLQHDRIYALHQTGSSP